MASTEYTRMRLSVKPAYKFCPSALQARLIHSTDMAPGISGCISSTSVLLSKSYRKQTTGGLILFKAHSHEDHRDALQMCLQIEYTLDVH